MSNSIDKTVLNVNGVLVRNILDAAHMEYPSEDNAVELFLTDCYHSYYELQVIMRDHDSLKRELSKLNDTVHTLANKLVTERYSIDETNNDKGNEET